MGQKEIKCTVWGEKENQETQYWCQGLFRKRGEAWWRKGIKEVWRGALGQDPTQLLFQLVKRKGLRSFLLKSNQRKVSADVTERDQVPPQVGNQTWPCPPWGSGLSHEGYTSKGVWKLPHFGNGNAYTVPLYLGPMYFAFWSYRGLQCLESQKGLWTLKRGWDCGILWGFCSWTKCTLHCDTATSLWGPGSGRWWSEWECLP